MLIPMDIYLCVFFCGRWCSRLSPHLRFHHVLKKKVQDSVGYCHTFSPRPADPLKQALIEYVCTCYWWHIGWHISQAMTIRRATYKRNCHRGERDDAGGWGGEGWGWRGDRDEGRGMSGGGGWGGERLGWGERYDTGDRVGRAWRWKMKAEGWGHGRRSLPDSPSHRHGLSWTG